MHIAQRPLNRTYVIAAGVLAFHAAALWALQSGLLQRAMEVVVPVAMLTELIEPPQPKSESRESQAQLRAPSPPPAKAAPAATPLPVAIPRAEPAPNAVTASPEPAVPMNTTAAGPANASVLSSPSAPPAPSPAPARVELPSTSAEYLQNPKPAYPPLSKRLGEQGSVIVRVLIGPDGLPQRAELYKASGFDRLDQAALATVMKWRYVPGKRAGVPETMWAYVPINFVLE
ncbi:energy transducer TonB [Caenimonas koreensis]|nr:energy transducer TonB [Caenimonas koreensis]